MLVLAKMIFFYLNNWMYKHSGILFHRLFEFYYVFYNIFSWNCGFINICGHLFVNKGKITISKIQKFVAKGQRDKILIEIALQQILNFVAKYNNEIHENLYSTEIDETTTILIRKYMAMCSCRWISYTVKQMWKLYFFVAFFLICYFTIFNL